MSVRNAEQSRRAAATTRYPALAASSYHEFFGHAPVVRRNGVLVFSYTSAQRDAFERGIRLAQRVHAPEQNDDFGILTRTGTGLSPGYRSGTLFHFVNGQRELDVLARGSFDASQVLGADVLIQRGWPAVFEQVRARAVHESLDKCIVRKEMYSLPPLQGQPYALARANCCGAELFPAKRSY